MTIRNVHYIKLGAGGVWERESFDRGIIRFGYDETDQELASAGCWTELKNAMRGVWTHSEIALSSHVAQVRKFYEADERDVFITFAFGSLYWCRPTGPVHRYDNGQHWRATVDGWRNQSLGGEQLSEQRLSGNLTKIAMFRGTICDLSPSQREYFVRKLNDETLPEVEAAITAQEELKRSIVAMLKLLTWRDFELLVDLIFTSSGWRRIAEVGRTAKTVDIELLLPSTQERAFVQVKSQTDDKQFADYLQRFADSDVHSRMFYVWHSGSVDEGIEHERVTLVGPNSLAEMIIESGLTSWLIEKAA
ncbi:hypothetical protein [Aestuariicoccus sp. MJ-SS9]|uniref:hypothetical protein n=1 Tax=Aestuariicoccus sp. MJ-SS9 TaxID=3079855 RepID=UPI002907A690|nr:hypothetical protein [Aestuariicoccus sp. MJ-SS9]MDU8910061.1 hypothetical protein [Aestuariicoccus sp. MJ-SS9]